MLKILTARFFGWHKKKHWSERYSHKNNTNVPIGKRIVDSARNLHGNNYIVRIRERNLPDIGRAVGHSRNATEISSDQRLNAFKTEDEMKQTNVLRSLA